MFSAIKFLFFNIICLYLTQAALVDQLISKANIYYQKPTYLGRPKEVVIGAVQSLNSKQQIKVIIHGFTGSRTHGSIRALGRAYLANGYDNIFLADWQDAAGLDYGTSRVLVGPVATHFAKLLSDFLSKTGIQPTNVHIIGHSLGAHIAGGIGKYFNGKLGRITGLDPALPLFTPISNDSLFSTAAQFVDVIHTDFPAFGDLTPRGTVDFYPNFGLTLQRGCENFDLKAVSELIFKQYSCSHNRAVTLYAETIGMPKNFPALPCSFAAITLQNTALCWMDLKSANIGKETLMQAISRADETNVVYMGEKVSRSATGFYYLQTYDAPPYGMGMNARF